MKTYKKEYDYLFLSPIFASISKTDYPSHFDLNELRELGRQKVIDRKVMALGGIDIDQIPQMRDCGFGGVVILGAFWQHFNLHETADFKELINYFRRLKKAAG